MQQRSELFNEELIDAVNLAIRVNTEFQTCTLVSLEVVLGVDKLVLVNRCFGVADAVLCVLVMACLYVQGAAGPAGATHHRQQCPTRLHHCGHADHMLAGVYRHLYHVTATWYFLKN